MKISIVTPSFNSVRFLREAMMSVITQRGDFSIEYIVVDNLSEDGTKEIVQQIQQLLENCQFPLSCLAVDLKFISEADRGMYDAINKGFSMATGDIFAWLNADDFYLPGALATMAKAFVAFPEMQWAKGITAYATEDSSIWRTGDCLLYAQEWIGAGVYGRDHYFIQQDSVFWRSALWHASGGIDAGLRRAGDYDLWIKFARIAPLISVNSVVSCFRKVDGQLSQDLRAYYGEAIRVSDGHDPTSKRARWQLKIARYLPALIADRVSKYIVGELRYSALTISSDGGLKRISGNLSQVQNAL